MHKIIIDKKTQKYNDSDEFKILCKEIIKEFGEEKLFYELESSLGTRDNYFTEELLIFIISNLDKSTDILFNYIKKCCPILELNEINNLIQDVLNGNIRIYPSELKRARIPLAIYQYIIQNNILYFSLERIIFFWKKILFHGHLNLNLNLSIEYKKLHYPIVFVFNDIKNLIFNKINIKYKKNINFLLLLNLKIPEYFNYLDNYIDKYCYKFTTINNILSKYI
jgi:hypothetical protein